MHFYKKQYFVTLHVTLSSLRTWKLSTKFYESYKLLISYQKNYNTKDKIKTNVHFDNMFTADERKVKWSAKYKNLYRVGIMYNLKDKFSTE